MAEGVRIRNLDKTTEVESDDVFILDRKSAVDPTISVTQSITYDHILSKITTDINNSGGGSSDFDPAEGLNYVAFKPSDSPVEIVVTVGPKTESHRYYNYTDSEGNSAATESYYFDSLEAPFLILVPGITYRLDVSDFSNTNFPMKFYVTPKPEFSDIGIDRITRVGGAGSAGAYIDIKLEGNVDPRIFYVSDNNFYMGNQIFDPGCDEAFENPFPDGLVPDFGFPVPSKQEFLNVVDRVTLSESKIEKTEKADERLRDNLHNSVEDIRSITDDLLDRITRQDTSIDSAYEKQVDTTTDIISVRQEIVDGDDEIKQTLSQIQSRLDVIESHLSKVIQIEDQ